MHTSYSSHYAQAYLQSYAPVPAPYVPPAPSRSFCPPGNARCSHTGCLFMGSIKALETHMMDRHLIYPPGWETRPKKLDWDADPSLRGKPIPIQGTSLILKTPEDLDAWLAERRRRWPTSSRVEEKKRKMEEAIVRGQLPEMSGFNGIKRRRMDGGGDSRCNGGGRGGGRGRNIIIQGRIKTAEMEWGGETIHSAQKVKVVPPLPVEQVPGADSLDEGDDDLPETASSKPSYDHIFLNSIRNPSTDDGKVTSRYCGVKWLPQPRKQPHNPFASRPTLLRNLLMPEIRMTISNLSQAIRFLVDNDFLDNVEVTPGGADSKIIKVLPDRPDAAVLSTTSNIVK